MKIMAVNPIYAGASHDSMVWALSSNRAYLEKQWISGDKQSWLLGSYSLKKRNIFLLTFFFFV